MSVVRKCRHAMFFVIAAALVFSSVATVQAAPEARNYLLATASTGGTYYPVGVALSTLVKVKLQIPPVFAILKTGMSFALSFAKDFYCPITLVKTMDFSPRLSVATHCFLLHWGEGARQGG